MDNFGAMYFSVLGVGPCQERMGPIQKCCSAVGVGEIFMLSRCVPTRIEIVDAPQFDLGAGGAGEAAVVLECGSDVEPFAAAEVSSHADVWLGVNYDGASNWS